MHVTKKEKIFPCNKIDKSEETVKRGETDMERNKIAVALGYEPSDDAPKIIASGQGHLADKIIDKATNSIYGYDSTQIIKITPVI